MKFTTNLKPLEEAVNLGIVDSNISQYYDRSTIVQLSADATTLKLNVESSMICTEITLNGSGEGEPASAFVDSSKFKKLIHTLDSNTVTLEFLPNGVKVQSGKSKFSIGNNIGDLVDASDMSLRTPETPSNDAYFMNIDKSDWAFIKENQMYAVTKVDTHPVYMYVWLGEDGDVITGDYDISLFTHSKKTKLGTTCLFSDTIINLMNSLPENAQIAKVGDSYIVKFSKDSYEYVTQFMPLYESMPEVGSYRSDILLSKMDHPDSCNVVSTGLITKLLNQALLLSTIGNNLIKLSVKNNVFSFDGENVNGQVSVDGDASIEYEISFRIDKLKQVIANYGDTSINISPVMDGTEPVGVTIWNDELTTIFAGAE